MRNKLDEMELIIDQYNAPDVIMVTETWIYNNESKYIKINNYTGIFTCRENGRGGGVAIFIKAPHTYEILKQETAQKCNYTTVKIISILPKITLSVVYKPPEVKLENLTDVLEEIMQRNSNAIICGDFNINLLENNSIVQKYLNITTMLGFTLLNQIAEDSLTRETKNSKSIIDHAFSNIKGVDTKLTLQNFPNLDHKIMHIKTNINYKKQKMENREIKIINYDGFKQIVKNTLNIGAVQNIDELVQLLKDAKEKNKIIRKIRTRNNCWMTLEIIEMQKVRRKLYERMKKYPESVKIKEEFKKSDKEIKAKIKFEKAKSANKQMHTAAGNLKKTWKILNEALNKNKQRNAITKITSNKVQYEKETDIANELNNYFINGGVEVNKFKNVKNVINNIWNEKTLEFQATTEEEIKTIITELNKNSAPGPDGITTKDLLILKDIISKPLSKMVNNIILSGNFPKTLKNTIVLPIFKSGDTVCPGNYRPISLISSLSKIIEKVIKSS